MRINPSFDDSYVETKQKLIKLAVEASKNLTTFALLEEIIELQGQFCYSDNELQKYNHDMLTTKCQLLYKKLIEHTSDLVDYGITDRKLMQFRQAMEDFQTISTQNQACAHHGVPEIIASN